MPVNHYWEWTRLELNIEQEQNYTPRYISPRDGDFQPGDFAYLDGNLHEVFCEFLERKQYRLRDDEDVPTRGTKGRYCLVLQRISLHKYIICFCASFGSATGFQDIADPVARHFGIPLNNNAKWPGIQPLKTHPRWKSEYGAFILGIPVVREGLQPTNILGRRIRLEYADLHRLQRLMHDRNQVRRIYPSSASLMFVNESCFKSFDRYANEIRAGHATYLKLKRKKMSAHFLHPQLELESDIPVIDTRSIKTPRSIPMPLAINKGRQNVRWVLEDIRKGVRSRSMYLNSLSFKQKRPILAKLPKPFFTSTVRMGIATINRLLVR